MPKIVHRIHPTVPLSGVVEAGDFLFVSGQLAFGADGKLLDGGVADQTRHILTTIDALLRPLNAGLDDIVKTTIWLADGADFAAFNDAYREVFKTAPPARSTLVSGLMLDARVEIEAVVYRPAFGAGGGKG